MKQHFVACGSCAYKYNHCIEMNKFIEVISSQKNS